MISARPAALHRSRIGLGTWPLGGRAYGPVGETQAEEVLLEAQRLGVLFFDTADIYGDGLAERRIGRALGGTEEIAIVSKAGYRSELSSEQDFSAESLLRAVRRSLRRLRRRRLDYFLLHSPPASVLASGLAFEAAERIGREGLADSLGVSIRRVEDFALVESWPSCSVLEVIVNLLDQRAIDSGVLRKAHARRMTVIARVPLCFGLLTGKYQCGRTFVDGDQRARWPREQLDAWMDTAQRFRFLERPDRTLAQASLAFCLAQPEISFVIPGMKSLEQVRENAAAAEESRRFTADELRRARALWSELRDLTRRP